MDEMKTKIELPDEVEYILKTLNKNGYEAYVVGGCVRDSLLGRTPDDWDITTAATPDEIKPLFEKTINTGLKHGTVTVMYGNGSFEVTTFRIDGAYEDNRRPTNVEFTRSLEADLSRRDFTMNAIAWHPEKGFIDPFNGVCDIQDRLICTVGNAAERFHEDALRMLRAIRFSAQLDFEIHTETLTSISENCSLVNNLSSERIREELTRTLTSERPLKLILLRDTGILQYILPELEVCFHTQQNNPHHLYNVGVHTLYSVAAVENDSCLRWVMLLHDIGKPVTKTTDEDGVDHFYGHPDKSSELASNILKRLRFDLKSSERIFRLIKYHDRDIVPTEKAVRRAVAAVGDDIFEDLLKVKEADRMAQNPENRTKEMNELANISRIYKDIKMKGCCLELKNLAIDGNDLMQLGLPEGRQISDTLEGLLKMVIDRPELNERNVLLKEAKNLIKEQCI